VKKIRECHGRLAIKLVLVRDTPHTSHESFFTFL
jgi:hypothetical protein